MAYGIEFRPRARRDLDRLPTKVRDRIATKINLLADNPRPPGCIKLSRLTNSYRIRIGDYRVLYEIHDDRRLVIVFIVANRRESCRGL